MEQGVEVYILDRRGSVSSFLDVFLVFVNDLTISRHDQIKFDNFQTILKRFGVN